jgi:hypothetical protein
MGTQEVKHNVRQNFIWILTSLLLTGLLGSASMSLAADGPWIRKADIPTAREYLSTSVVNGIIYAIGGFIPRVVSGPTDNIGITESVRKWGDGGDARKLE